MSKTWGATLDRVAIQAFSLVKAPFRGAVDVVGSADVEGPAMGGECQKPGALRRELDCWVAKPPVQHRRPDLKHTMGASR